MFKENPDLYPTPTKLIHKMLSKIDFRANSLKSILEPSAGRGDLVEAIKKQFESSQYRNKKYDIDTIEKDESLIHVLSGKGFRVIHNDYLTFFSHKRYDAIIANFPFSAGDKHFMKSIELMENQNNKCHLVCLINAETIKNPYSNIRKEIINKLEQYDAEVEFIENAFVDADRKTNVEIALISLIVNNQSYESTIINKLKQEEKQEINNKYESESLIHNDFIEGIVSQYNYEVKAGLKLIDEYNALVPYMLKDFSSDTPILKLDLDYRANNDDSSLENAYIKKVREKYWKALFTNDKFIGLFTSNLRKKYLEKIDELKDYDFSLYNIYTLRIQLNKEMIKGVEDTILDLFEELSNKYHYYSETSKNVHYYNGWATNKAYKINHRVIIPLNAYNQFWGKYEPTDYKIVDKLKDIEKVFVYLDNDKTELIDIKEELKRAEHYGETRKIEFSYFYCSFFKKGTMHLEFKNLELLKKFNNFAGKHFNFLPPTYGKVRYNDMTPEEQEIINNFEGKDSYNKVMSNTAYYIMNTEKLLLIS